jgi:hypothetical protein
MKRDESARTVGQVQELKVFEIEEWFTNIFKYEQLVTSYIITTQQSNTRREREKRERRREDYWNDLF